MRYNRQRGGGELQAVVARPTGREKGDTCPTETFLRRFETLKVELLQKLLSFTELHSV